MSPGEDDRSRPPAGSGSETVTATNTESTTASADFHGALIAESAAPWWNRLAWEQAVEREAVSGRAFTVDDLQANYDLPGIGTAAGGVIMRAARSGRIVRLGFRPSRRPSRAGGIVSIWIGAPGGAR